MYECPNCGGNLKFDIVSQDLMCAFCNTHFDPYQISKQKDAEEDRVYDVTIFTCPQCGGEIYSTDNTAAGFCSFCGASTILDSRLSKEQRPGYIIPFKQTKEDCKRAYTKMMRRAIFAPKELKDAKHIDEFRGIYMPYWVYYISHTGPVCLHGTRSNRKGDYIITKHYNLNGYMDFHYKGLSYDASSSFADNISERIAPFDVKNMTSFTPSFLSGFYADSADVGKALYQEDAKKSAADATLFFIQQYPDVKKYHLEDNKEKIAWKFNTKCESADTAMFPVWFLSYQNNGRVAYATVNGQTGKVVADLPVDIRKFMGGSLILAIIIFILLNLFFTFKPAELLTMIVVIALSTIILHAVEMDQIVKRDECLDDKGAMEVLKNKKTEEMAAGKTGQTEPAATMEAEPQRITAVGMKQTKAKNSERNKKKKIFLKKQQREIDSYWKNGNRQENSLKEKIENTTVRSTVVLIVFGSWVLSALSKISVYQNSIFLRVMLIAVIAVAGIASYVSYTRYKKIEVRKGMPGFIGGLIAVVIAVMILLWKPVSDIFYYAGAVAALIAVFFTLFDLIQHYNILATRRLPQFDHKGGDDRA